MDLEEYAFDVANYVDQKSHLHNIAIGFDSFSNYEYSHQETMKQYFGDMKLSLLIMERIKNKYSQDNFFKDSFKDSQIFLNSVNFQQTPFFNNFY